MLTKHILIGIVFLIFFTAELYVLLTIVKNEKSYSGISYDFPYRINYYFSGNVLKLCIYPYIVGVVYNIQLFLMSYFGHIHLKIKPRPRLHETKSDTKAVSVSPLETKTETENNYSTPTKNHNKCWNNFQMNHIQKKVSPRVGFEPTTSRTNGMLVVIN